MQESTEDDVADRPHTPPHGYRPLSHSLLYRASTWSRCRRGTGVGVPSVPLPGPALFSLTPCTFSGIVKCTRRVCASSLMTRSDTGGSFASPRPTECTKGGSPSSAGQGGLHATAVKPLQKQTCLPTDRWIVRDTWLWVQPATGGPARGHSTPSVSSSAHSQSFCIMSF